jgi:hypothetical protein
MHGAKIKRNKDFIAVISEVLCYFTFSEQMKNQEAMLLGTKFEENKKPLRKF